ncbi:MAG TPA: MaoC family dehydratase [Stellaceae bacterium]|nr:MaoC family dehydratase [Stellaceae bacterium]
MRYFEDFIVGEAHELGARTLSQDQLVAFARDYDPQPFHVDPIAAKSSIYGGLIASGWQTVAVFMSLLVNGLLNDTASLGSPGIEGIQWLKPVRPGDRLSARLRVLEATPSKSRPDRGIVKTQGEMTNQAGELVMTIRAVNFFGRRPGSA